MATFPHSEVFVMLIYNPVVSLQSHNQTMEDAVIGI